jgi:SpoVK/Ycf46/Vps4 family AAA+-type ATPase
MGVRALFTGPSGTGKTLAAGLLATLPEVDAYQMDLAAVVSKYIGETERNLHRAFSQGRALDILLLDEADALFDQRTEVRAAADPRVIPGSDHAKFMYSLDNLSNKRCFLALEPHFPC